MTPNEIAAELRTANAKVAAGYDAMPFDPRLDPAIDPDRVLGMAALYGAGSGGTIDVLDLGCGTGVQLARAGALTQGRLVGIDLSASALGRAHDRCASLGEQCTIMHGDVAEADPAGLGQFDLIYHVGVLYLTPPAVQGRILSVIASCLKPQGVALISYFAGLGAMAMTGLNQMLRAQDDGSASPKARIAAARARIEELSRLLEQASRDQIMLQVLRYARGCDDSILFHEMLNQPLSTIPTVALEAGLAPHGVNFLNWIAPGPFGDAAVAGERARIADAVDLMGGGYHYGVFAKVASDARPDARRVRWETQLKRTSGSVFTDAASGRSVNIATPATAAALEALTAGPTRLVSPDPAVQRDVLGLWQMGLMTPLPVTSSQA